MSDASPAGTRSWSGVRRALGFVAPLPAYFGLSTYLYEQRTNLVFGWASRLAGSAALAALFLLCLAAAFGEVPRDRRAAWRSTLKRLSQAGIPLVPLAFLPFAARSPTWALALFAVALLAHCSTYGRSMADADPESRGDPLNPFEVSLLGFCLLVLIVYVQIGARADGSFQNDSAYYFGVAKFMARTAKFQEPIVWHFLRKPAKLPTLPFDYWGGLTSVVLAPFLALFGQTHRVANVVMAVLSAGSVALFGYLLAVERLVRNRLVAAALLIGFALVPALSDFRFDTESIPLYHVLVLCTLLLALRGRWAWASFAAGLLYHVRPDALVVTLLVWAWALYQSRKRGGLRRVVAVQAIVLVVTLGYDLLAFGTPFGVRAIAVRLPSQFFLYRWGFHPQVHLIASRLDQHSVAKRMGEVVRTLGDIIPGGVVLLSLIVTAGVMTLRDRARDPQAVRALLWCLSLPCAMAIGIASGPMFAPWRTLHPLIPLVMLSGGCALDCLVRAVHPLEGPARWFRRAGAMSLSLVVAVMVVWHLSLYGYRASAPLRPRLLELRKLNGLLHGEVVASNLPWYVIADTDSPSVNIPVDGPRALEQVLKRYHARWILIMGRAWSIRKAVAVLPIRHAHTRLGEFSFQRRIAKAGFTLIRVTDLGR